jgi:hypothetical protein
MAMIPLLSDGTGPRVWHGCLVIWIVPFSAMSSPLIRSNASRFRSFMAFRPARRPSIQFQAGTYDIDQWTLPESSDHASESPTNSPDRTRWVICRTNHLQSDRHSTGDPPLLAPFGALSLRLEKLVRPNLDVSSKEFPSLSRGFWILGGIDSASEFMRVVAFCALRRPSASNFASSAGV